VKIATHAKPTKEAGNKSMETDGGKVRRKQKSIGI
jgi:hypothetical protein